ncbi:phytoene desaturase family protein [Paenibacillus aurantius]|uniref:4,4'-diaponeurosporene oxygenase n=1 Tax=Paenibacillus aurantius TaxID=2918900 RepID=A0AA96RED0_9BACL|nr:phytoene desaturase family protein [Paenibacillus aurantius]WNQ10018.1 phytoene desaturase family protein [Paenibacillus aurantius]
MKKVIVIGAGLGGLSCAIRLAHAGYRVTVVEAQETAGGKLQRVRMGEYSFDRGPSTITMPHLFERVFTSVGRRMEDYLTLRRLEPAARNIFPDGSRVDLTEDREAMQEQIARYSPEDALRYPAFMKEAEALYREAEKHFLSRMLLTWKDKLSPRLAAGFLRIRPLTTLQERLEKHFRHPYTLGLFGRYATYVGSSPYRAPAIFAMLAHVEASLGIYAVQGGTYAIPEAFVRLARELGVDIRTGGKVKLILVRGGRAAGVELQERTEPQGGPGESADAGYGARTTPQGERLEADLVVANGDVLTVCRELLDEEDRPAMPDKRIDRYEPSLSGFVILAGVRNRYEELLHHTVFFPEDYGSEFGEIFDSRTAPQSPAIYLCHSGHSEPGLAPEGGSNLFILVNAPYTSKAWDWEEHGERYRDFILRRLAEYGLKGIDRPDVSAVYTPEQLKRDTGAYRGAIYGISSNSARQTFFRPTNRAANIPGLWFTGGTTHPGGGTPMVTLSGQLVAERILEEDRGRAAAFRQARL